MPTLDLIEAAKYLKMNAEVLRRKTKNGEIPGRKAGKGYVFIATDEDGNEDYYEHC